MSTSKEKILREAQNIVVMGCSERTARTSHHIAKYLQNHSYRIIPVNPNYDEILGEKVYETLQDVPDDIRIDVADIFRNKKYTAEMVDQIIARANTAGHDIAVWTQLDVSSQEAKRKAEQAGLPYVKNECMMVEHRRLAAE